MVREGLLVELRQPPHVITCGGGSCRDLLDTRRSRKIWRCGATSVIASQVFGPTHRTKVLYEKLKLSV